MALKDSQLPGNYFVAGVWPPALRDADMIIRFESKTLMGDCCMIHIARPFRPGFIIIIRYPDRDFPMIALVEEDASKSFLDYMLNSEVLQKTWVRMQLKNRFVKTETLSSLVRSQLDGSPVTLQVSLEAHMDDMRKGFSLCLTSSVD
ncbi:uncharacterized protein F4807DRAFT_417318 [Annulohypoxylon truncatum]|uniref:uncharacterized protein n=1 Tax=Annulohypoxylon truncatum TaxID=327061 RepID=UPI0020076ACA|nr:uncharacterized protein F4807DRAFT_417318 [Annulohypoxylon truncatum]KAI1212028.1 hypothetical protein F4807DRAFT_417318 [Annulohypoxylon truncatum]